MRWGWKEIAAIATGAIGTYYILSIGDGAVVAPVAANSDFAMATRLLHGMGTQRIKPLRLITITGTVVGVAPHFAPDGDGVFAFKPDPPNQGLVNAQNMAQPKMGGGLWLELMCQKQPNALALSHPWHQGDCVNGGPFPKWSLPKLGDKLRVTGVYSIDTREGGHAEIHPVIRMSKI